MKTQPEILIIIDDNHTQNVSETLDAALALASFAENVQLWFKDAGIHQLLRETDPVSAHPEPRPAPIIEALELYGIDQVFITRSAINLKYRHRNQFRIATKWVIPAVLGHFLNRYHYIMRFG